MCGLSTKGEKQTLKNIQNQLDYISKLPQLNKVESLYISPYSFFSDNEMPYEARQRVYKIINSHPNIEYAVFMTRPGYISEIKLAELRRELKQKIIVFMGAETSDPFISKYCIDKGYNWKDIEQASRLMQKYHIQTGIWVLLKPPFVA